MGVGGAANSDKGILRAIGSGVGPWWSGYIICERVGLVACLKRNKTSMVVTPFQDKKMAGFIVLLCGCWEDGHD